jgi:hypothetical protein
MSSIEFLRSTGHLKAEFVPKLRVESFHRSDSEGCTIVTIERHSPDRFSTGPLYMCAPRARGLAPSRVFLLYRTDNRLLLHQEPPRFGSRLKFWRTTGGPNSQDCGFKRPRRHSNHQPLRQPSWRSRRWVSLNLSVESASAKTINLASRTSPWLPGTYMPFDHRGVLRSSLPHSQNVLSSCGYRKLRPI